MGILTELRLIPRVVWLILLLAPTLSHAIRGGENTSDATNTGITQLSSLIVSIEKLRGQKYQHACSGFIISSHQMMTAAHCFDDQDFHLRLSSSFGFLKASRIGIHQSYQRTDLIDDYWKFVYDIKIQDDYALIEFQSNTKQQRDISDSLQQISPKLSDNKDTPNKVYVMGYGQTANIFGMGEGEGTLRFTGPLAISSGQNHDITDHQDLSNPQDNHRLEIRHNSKGACQGDSGGPLFALDNGNTIFIGIVSQGDCNTFSRYQLLSEGHLKSSQYVWFPQDLELFAGGE